MDAILRLNLGGANPQVFPSDSYDAKAASATKSFQASHHLKKVDGKIGPETWRLLDQLDGGRLDSAADLDSMKKVRIEARALLDDGDFAGAKAILEPVYARPGLPPERRWNITIDLGWAEHGLGNFDRATHLYQEVLFVQLLSPAPAKLFVNVVRDILQRLREVVLKQTPGPLVSEVNKTNLPPDG